MKNLVYTFLLAIGMHSTVAQSIEWTKLFDTHSQNSLGGLSKNTIKDSNDNLISAIVESDILKVYQFDAEGNIIRTLNTSRECGFFTPIVKVNADNYALVFDNTPDEIYASFKLLFFNTNLGITQEIELNFPGFDFFTFGSLFTKDGVIYLTGFASTSHLMYCLNDANELILKSILPINNAYTDKTHLLQNGSVLFEYGEGQNHQLKCISAETGQLLWDRYFVTNDINTFQLNYKINIGENQNIYFSGLERTWVSGQAVDTFKLKMIDSANGNSIQESAYILPDNGTANIDDVKFNPVNNHLYVSYLSSYPAQDEAVLEFDANFSLVNQVRFAYIYDNLSNWVKSEILVRDSGDLIFIYTNYKNESENGNLYVVNLASDLTVNGSLEFNIEPKNSSESFSHFLMYDNTKLLITGCIPNPDPAIGFEEVQYYLAMIDVDRGLSIETPYLKPKSLLTSNPVANTLNVNTDITIKDIAVYDVLGKTTLVKPLTNNTFDVSDLTCGVYYINVIDRNGVKYFSKFIKE